MKKRLVLFLTTVLFVLSVIPGFAIRANAASKDVTKEMITDKELKQVCKMISAYTTAIDIGGGMTSQQIKVKLDDINTLSIAAFVRYNYKGDVGYTKKELKSETEQLFGKKAKINIIKKSDKAHLLVCTSDKFVKEPYMYCGGEFGDTLPLYKIKKVTYSGKNTYKVLIQNRIGIYGEKGADKLGTTTLKLKKSKTSGYGFLVKQITYNK